MKTILRNKVNFIGSNRYSECFGFASLSRTSPLAWSASSTHGAIQFTLKNGNVLSVASRKNNEINSKK